MDCRSDASEAELKPDGAPASRTSLSHCQCLPELFLTIKIAVKVDKQALVELKNGKVLFRQKPLSCEKMSETMQGMDFI